MIIRRLADAFREQNSFVAVLEFVIVVAGIFVALQADDWNNDRKKRTRNIRHWKSLDYLPGN